MIRRMTWVPAVLLALSVLGWIVYVPPSAMRMLKPVPAHAHIIYRSETPDFPASERFGFKTADRFFRIFKKHPLILATVPFGGRDRRDTQVAVSAVGHYAFLLRWRMTLFSPEGIKPARSYGLWPVWQYSDPSLPPWMRVRFTITEGLLICSISDDSHDIYYLLDTFDGRRPSADRKE